MIYFKLPRTSHKGSTAILVNMEKVTAITTSATPNMGCTLWFGEDSIDTMATLEELASLLGQTADARVVFKLPNCP